MTVNNKPLGITIKYWYRDESALSQKEIFFVHRFHQKIPALKKQNSIEQKFSGIIINLN